MVRGRRGSVVDLPSRLSRRGRSIIATWRRFGVATILWLTVERLLNLITAVRISNVVWLERARAHVVVSDTASFEFRLLGVEDVGRFVTEFGQEFVDRAVAGRDLCFAALAGERLAAYGWYALESVEPRHAFGVAMSYPNDVAYMYNGFTLPAYRGSRLHGAIMGLALERLNERGITKLVSLVECTNTPSMRSCFRTGYELLGRLWTVQIGSHTVIFSPRRARRLGVKFGAMATRPR
jgi:acetyltransferase (GNAT) family protein